MSGHKWSETELEELERLAGEMPLTLLLQTYNRWTALNGYPRRSRHAVSAKIRRRELRVYSDGEYISRNYAALLIGARSAERITRIIRDRQPRVAREGVNQFVNRRDLAAAARKHPEDWYGVNWDGLFALFEDENLADEVAARAFRPRFARFPRPVRCLVTGKVYRTLGEAAEAANCGQQTIRRCAESGRASSWGQRWEWV